MASFPETPTYNSAISYSNSSKWKVLSANGTELTASSDFMTSTDKYIQVVEVDATAYKPVAVGTALINLG